MNIQIWKNGKSFYGKIKILNKTHNLRFGRVSHQQAKQMAEDLKKQLIEKYGAKLMSPVEAFQEQIEEVISAVGKQLGDTDKPAEKKGKRTYKKRAKKSADKSEEQPAEDQEDDQVPEGQGGDGPVDKKRGKFSKSLSKEFNEKVQKIENFIAVSEREVELSTEIAEYLQANFDIGTSPEYAAHFWKWHCEKRKTGWLGFSGYSRQQIKDKLNQFLTEIK